MKISKLFHWLYAILMFLPFGLLVYNALASMWSGTVIDGFAWYDNFDMYLSSFFTGNGIVATLFDVYDYLIFNIFGIGTGDYTLGILVEYLLTYWTCISIIWLVFDVFMYVPLLVHRWIDKAKLE